MVEFIIGLEIKRRLEHAWSFIKKYWQFFLGLSVGLVILILTRDNTGIKKTFKKFKETSDKMIENSLEIEKRQDEKILEAVDKYAEDISNAESNYSDATSALKERESEALDKLLEEEEENRGHIADKINDHLK